MQVECNNTLYTYQKMTQCHQKTYDNYIYIYYIFLHECMQVAF